MSNTQKHYEGQKAYLLFPEYSLGGMSLNLVECLKFYTPSAKAPPLKRQPRVICKVIKRLWAGDSNITLPDCSRKFVVNQSQLAFTLEELHEKFRLAVTYHIKDQEKWKLVAQSNINWHQKKIQENQKAADSCDKEIAELQAFVIPDVELIG